MHLVQQCPICDHGQFIKKIDCKDYTVSHETFAITECQHCGLLLTNPQPERNLLEKYYLSDDYISHTNKPKTLIDLIYKISRGITLNWKYNLIHKYQRYSPIKVLDFGSGTGNFLKKCFKRGDQAFGIEPSEKARTIANQETGLTIFSSLQELKQRVNVITAWHVLEHVPDPLGTLKNLNDKLEQTGTMFIAVPNHNSYDALLYKEQWAGYDVPRHLWHFSKQDMSRLLAKSGFDLIDILPMKLDAFYVSLLSEKYIDGKTTIAGLFKGFINGLLSNLKGRRTINHSSLIYIAKKK